MKLYSIFLGILIIICSCQESQQKKTTQEPSNNGTEVRTTYYKKSGALKSEITVQGNKKNGPAKEYYPSGELRTLVYYSDNIKVGESIWYYKNGQPYRVTPHVNGKMEGIRKVYYENGKLQAEIPYKSGELIEGTIEYDNKGNKKHAKVKIIFESQDLIKYSNKYILKTSLSNKSGRVKFYEEKISTEGKKIKVPIPTNSGKGRIEYMIPYGTFKMDVVKVYAEYKTSLGNPILIHSTYNLAVDNR